MDIISMIMSRNNGGGEPLAYEEYTYAPISFDGNMTDKVIINATDLGFENSGRGYFKISDEPIPVNNIEEIFMKWGNGTPQSSHFNFNIAKVEEDVYFVFSEEENASELPLIFVVDDSNSDIYGTWAMAQLVPELLYVNYISGKIKKLIHPIDPKYIPGAVLPVVEIASAPYPIDGSTVALSAEESKELSAAIATGLPAVIKYFIQQGDTDDTKLPFSIVADNNGGFMFYGKNGILDKYLRFVPIDEDGNWGMGDNA